MGKYLTMRFWMGNAKVRRENAWINKPIDVGPTRIDKVIKSWFHWRRYETPSNPKETISEWLQRTAPTTIKHLLDPNYGFYNDALDIAGVVAGIPHYDKIYREVFGREELTDGDYELYERLRHMYVLRLRHDCYELPAKYRTETIPLHKQELFACIPGIENPPSVDIEGFYWMHPAVPEDTEKEQYFWNRIFRGEHINHPHIKGENLKLK